MARAGVHVALLRGINVGGKHKLPMKDLAAIFEAAGCSDVSTYIQSGNVVYRATAAVARGIAETIPAAIEQRFGFAAPVVTRPVTALRELATDNPFLAADADPKTLHVVFLAAEPRAAALAALDPERSPPDAFIPSKRGSELYLCCPNGVARSKLTNAYFNRALRTTSTARNWRTVGALLARCDALG